MADRPETPEEFAEKLIVCRVDGGLELIRARDRAVAAAALESILMGTMRVAHERASDSVPVEALLTSLRDAIRALRSGEVEPY